MRTVTSIKIFAADADKFVEFLKNNSHLIIGLIKK